LNNLKFFIVDDDPYYRMLYQQHLTNLGYKNYYVFENGIDCVNQLAQQPDIIFLDYDMKPNNGLEILKMIKKENNNIFLLMISSQSEHTFVSRALAHGADEYIVKGENDLELIKKVIADVQISIQEKRARAIR